jgi:hypothetical protein
MTSLSACLAVPLLIVSFGAANAAGSSLPHNAKSQAPSDVLAVVQVAAAYGTVTSLFRSAAHNRAVGGVRNSYHLRGQAIDVVRRASVSHQAVEVAMIVAGYQIIESLDEGDHSHFAFASGQHSTATGPALRRPGAHSRTDQTNGRDQSTRRVPPALAADQHGSLMVTASPLLVDELKVVSGTPRS